MRRHNTFLRSRLGRGLVWLMTMRGIPQMYYGTEILMKNFAAPDGLVREDFPGGWAGDQFNKFESSGRTRAENEVFNLVKRLANWRKTSASPPNPSTRKRCASWP